MTRPKRVVKARLFGKRAPRAPEVLQMTAIQLPKAAEQSSSEEEEFLNQKNQNLNLEFPGHDGLCF